MKKSLESKTVYKPNPKVSVTVVNKPSFDDNGMKIGYDAKVTVSYSTSKLDEVKFTTDEEISDFICAIDFTDPQQELIK